MADKEYIYEACDYTHRPTQKCISKYITAAANIIKIISVVIVVI